MEITILQKIENIPINKSWIVWMRQSLITRARQLTYPINSIMGGQYNSSTHGFDPCDRGAAPLPLAIAGSNPAGAAQRYLIFIYY